MKRSHLTKSCSGFVWVAMATLGGCVAPDDGGASVDARPQDVPRAAAKAEPPAQQAIEPAAQEVGRTFVFDCSEGPSFTVRTGPGEVALWMPVALGGRYLVLSLTQSASGARYEEGDTSYWSKGELATFEVGGRSFIDCRSNPAKVPWADAARRGVVFRALGNEPSWNLEIAKDQLVLLTDLGATRTETSYAATTEGPKTTYRGPGDDDLVAVVERRACSDSMSGEAFEAAATVTFAGKMFYGCGRFL